MKKYNTYKDSGIQWIGDIPGHWSVRKLFQIADSYYESNKGMKNKNLLSLSYGTIIQKDINKTDGLLPASFETYQIVKPNIIVLRLTDLQNDQKSLRVGISKQEGIVTSAYEAIKVRKPNNADFIYYQLHANDIHKVFYGMGNGLRQNLNYDGMRYMLIVTPPLSEQEEIVSFLNNKTTLIEQYLTLKKKELLVLQELIESTIYSSSNDESIIIKSWDNCFPNNEILKSGRSLFEEIIVKGISDERFLAVTQDKGLIYKDTDDVNFVTAGQKETQKLVEPNQFVISLRSFEGGIEFSDKKGLVSPAYVIFKFREQYDTPLMRTFYRFLFKSSPFVRRLNTISDSMRDGKSIKFSDITNFMFPLPSENKLNKIMQIAQVYDLRKEAFYKEKELLDEYKQRLIADVVTGKINVQPN